MYTFNEFVFNTFFPSTVLQPLPSATAAAFLALMLCIYFCTSDDEMREEKKCGERVCKRIFHIHIQRQAFLISTHFHTTF